MSHTVLASGMAAETQSLTFWILAVVSVSSATPASREPTPAEPSR